MYCILFFFFAFCFFFFFLQFNFICTLFRFVLVLNIFQLLYEFGYDYDIYTILLFTMPLIMVCANLRRLRFIAPLSTLANFALMTGVITILYYSCSDLSLENRRYSYAKWSELPTMFGIIMFSFEGIGLVSEV